MADLERVAKEAAEAQAVVRPAQCDHRRGLTHSQVDEDAECADHHAREQQALQAE